MRFQQILGFIVLGWSATCATISPASAAPFWQQIDVLHNGTPGLTGLDGVYDLAFSPDGRHVYTAAYNSSAVAVFERNPATGELIQQQVLWNNTDGVTGIGATRALRLSPDGKFAYAVGASDNSVAIFSRDATSGNLTFLTRFTNGGPLHGLLGANAMNISPDGKFVYISSESNHSLSTFARDAITGSLSFVETLKDGVDGMGSLNTIRSFTLAEDDRFLYAPARNIDRITQFDRDATTGELSVAQISVGMPNLNGPTHITFSPDGMHAYVAAQFSDTLSIFDVDTVNGNLTFKKTYYDNTPGFEFLNHAEDIVITADGELLFITATLDHAMSIYQRDPITGELTFHQAFRNGVDGIEGLFRPREIFLSPDQRFLYLLSPEGQSIAIFAVPEPATLGLAGIAAASLAWVACRRGRQSRIIPNRSPLPSSLARAV